jgi:hypothetical protein
MSNEINLARLNSIDKLVKARVLPNIHMQYLNLTQLYQLFLNSYEKKQRLEYLMAMHNLAKDFSEVCLITNAEPEAEIYKQLEGK